MDLFKGLVSGAFLGMATFLAFTAVLFRPAATSKIADRLYAIRTLMVSFYVYESGYGLIAFDSGMNPAAAARGMKSLGLDPQQVLHVFLTHSDYDHAGGLAAFPNAEVHMYEKEVALATGKVARRLFMKNSVKKYFQIHNSKPVTVGNDTIEIVPAVGHTPGSCCYLLNKKWIFVGDLMLLKDGKPRPFARLMDMSHSQSVESLNGIVESGILSSCDIIATAHGGIATKNEESKAPAA
ncbi:MAG: MBL fold metallo-hydrolase [Eubacteriaceae bacterium]|jgi:glyoxylase-like metal-dependent hydrolase (beta-lactamase superfamily II)|nr:MBL fold metallo-hydrolase [Eubacteriaceae bacterium]